LKVCNIVEALSFLCGCEVWALEQRHMSTLNRSRGEIHELHSGLKFIRSWKNEAVLEDFNVDPVDMKLAQYKSY
jgi:hypothetical protein